MYEKYPEGTYRAMVVKSWGIDFVEKMTSSGTTNETFINIPMIIINLVKKRLTTVRF
jgi:hypothetical protein